MVKVGWYIVFLGLLAASCTPKTDTPTIDDTVAARVYDQVLYETDVLKSIPSSVSSEDSLSIRNSIINSWVNGRLMVRQAEMNLADEEKDVDKKLEKYRQDLLIYSYQNQLLKEKLDTIVSDEEIESYYLAHEEMFRLADDIVKAHYIKIDSTTVKNNNLRTWLFSDEDDDFLELEEFCYMHSANFYLEDNWVYLDELLRQVPIVVYNKEKLLKKKKLIEFYDSGFLYLVRIVDYKLKDSISPLALERNNIKRIILNNRKIEFLDNLSVDIYQKAKNQNQIEIFIHK